MSDNLFRSIVENRHGANGDIDHDTQVKTLCDRIFQRIYNHLRCTDGGIKINHEQLKICAEYVSEMLIEHSEWHDEKTTSLVSWMHKQNMLKPLPETPVE